MNWPRRRLALWALCCAAAGGFAPAAAPRRARAAPLAAKKLQRKWQNERTLLKDEVPVSGGGGSSLEDKGITGAIDVVFKQGNATRLTKADVGAPLSEVAARADQFVRYKCKKGECGTCEVQVAGKWVRTCVATVPYVEPGQAFEVTVKPSMVGPTKKSSKFYSFKSFVMGWYNNILGMVGFVKTSATEAGGNLKHRLDTEEEILAAARARKAARRAAEAASK